MGTGVQELKLAARMQEWSTRIAECRSSGMSVRAWCKEQGIAIQTYYHWEKRFVSEVKEQNRLLGLIDEKTDAADKSRTRLTRDERKSLLLRAAG